MALLAVAARLFIRRPLFAKYSDDYQANTATKGRKEVIAPKRSRFVQALIYVVLPVALLGTGFYVSATDLDCTFR